MARDPLGVLLAVRQRSVEQARQALGVCLTAEADVAAKIRSLDEMMQRDRAASEAWQDAYRFQDMAATRLASMRERRQSIIADLAAAEARSADARGVVTAARTAAEAVEKLIEERTAALRVEAEQRGQHELDDIARARLAAVRRGDAW